MNYPKEGTIERGRVSRIETYGAFIDLESYRKRGLVHISELVSFKVEKVEDAVSLDDIVWVKVLSVTEEDKDGRILTRIKLSMKDVSQDGSKKDLSKGREMIELMREKITQNLNSSIGMGVALDPMEKKSTLVLKSDPSTRSTLINGYALLDDETPVVPLVETGRMVKAIRRGRGMTLPAWMTKKTGPFNDPFVIDAKRERKERRKLKRKAEREHRRERKDKRESKNKHKRHKERHRCRRHLGIESDIDDNYPQNSSDGSNTDRSSLSMNSHKLSDESKSKQSMVDYDMKTIEQGQNVVTRENEPLNADVVKIKKYE